MAENKIILERTYRLRDCFTFLKNNGLVGGYPDIAQAMNIPYASVRAAFSPSSQYISEEFIESFVKAYPNIFSMRWIKEGSGRMLQHSADQMVRKAKYPLRWQRVQHIMDAEGLDYKEFSKEIGLKNNTTIYRTVVQHSRPQDGTLHAILKRFPEYSKSWLIDGKGPIKEADAQMTVHVPEGVNADLGNAVPFTGFESRSFPVMPDSAAAGTLTNYEDQFPDDPLEVLDIPTDKEYAGHYCFFTIKGVSMDDGSMHALAEGDVVLAREIPKQYWQYKLHNKTWRYFIFMSRSEGIIVKSIVDQDLESGDITLRSLNKNYPDIVLNMNDIMGIYNVIEVTKRSLRF